MLDRSSEVENAFARLGIGLPEPEEPPPYESIPESADGDPIFEPVAAGEGMPHSLGEWDAGDFVDLPPPREWLLGNQFCRRFLSGLLAPGATGRAVAESQPSGGFSFVPIIKARACNAQPSIGQNQLMNLLVRVGRSNEIQKCGRCAMLFALEVNFALWIMIGYGLAEYLA